MSAAPIRSLWKGSLHGCSQRLYRERNSWNGITRSWKMSLGADLLSVDWCKVRLIEKSAISFVLDVSVKFDDAGKL